MVSDVPRRECICVVGSVVSDVPGQPLNPRPCWFPRNASLSCSAQGLPGAAQPGSGTPSQQGRLGKVQRRSQAQSWLPGVPEGEAGEAPRPRS